LAGICFPRSEACATSSCCLCRNLNSWTRGASKPSLVRAHSQAGALTVCGYHRQSDAQSGTRRHARTAAVLMAAGSNQAAIGQAAGRTTPSLLCTVVVTRRRRRVASFAFPPGDAPTGASSESTDNAAARSRHHSAQSRRPTSAPSAATPALPRARAHLPQAPLKVGYPASAAGPARRK
jgi:hypothetical protein